MDKKYSSYDKLFFLNAILILINIIVVLTLCYLYFTYSGKDHNLKKEGRETSAAMENAYAVMKNVEIKLGYLTHQIDSKGERGIFLRKPFETMHIEKMKELSNRLELLEEKMEKINISLKKLLENLSSNHSE